MRAKSLTGPVVGLYLLRMLLVAAIFFVLLVSLLALQRENTRAHGTTDTLIAALDTEHTMSQLMGSLRGYLLTGNRTMLRPFEDARKVLPGQLDELVGDAQRAGARTAASGLVSAVHNALLKYELPLTAPGSTLALARTRAQVERSSGAAAALQRRFSEFVDEIIALRTRQHSQVTSQVSLAIALAAIGLAVALALDVGFQLFLVRGVLRPIRSVARAAARLARGDLSVRVPRTGLGEVAMLADSFNGMAASTQERTTELASAQERLAHAAAVAEEASAMKSTFVANITHEIRTPLNGLVGMLSLLAETPLDDTQRNYVSVARSSSDALMNVVDDALDIAKIEAGRLEIEHVELDLHELVESVCELMAASASAKRVSLQPFIRDDVPRVVVGDRTRIAQILQNLVSNAVKFTPEGEVTVEVGLVSSSVRSVRVRFEVLDTGIGVEPARLTRLFEPFVQAEPGTTRKYGGTGLGLAIARQLTELMGGTIGGASVPGEGSTFRFELPLERARDRAEAPAADGGLAGRRVLIAARDQNTREVIRSYVEAWGMEAHVAADLGEALAAFEDAARAGEPLEVVLLDAALGGPGAADVSRALGEAPEANATPLILLTPATGGADEEPGTIRLSKPVRRARLLLAVTAALAAPAEPAVATNGSSPHTAHRVLVAEDHDVNWLVMERMLATRGHQADRAADGERVLELVAERDYDLVLIDCQMPVRDGFETTRELRRREQAGELRRAPGTGHLPIVAMTAGSLDGTRDRCLAAGMDDYLAKPIELSELDTILERWLPHEAPGSLDRSRIDVLQRLFPGTELQKMVGEVRAEVERDLFELGSAIRQRDQARMAAAAHRIRNAGQLLGADELVACAAELDHPPRVDRQPAAFDEGALMRLQKHWASTQAALAQLPE